MSHAELWKHLILNKLLVFRIVWLFLTPETCWYVAVVQLWLTKRQRESVIMKLKLCGNPSLFLFSDVWFDKDVFEFLLLMYYLGQNDEETLWWLMLWWWYYLDKLLHFPYWLFSNLPAITLQELEFDSLNNYMVSVPSHSRESVYNVWCQNIMLEWPE